MAGEPHARRSDAERNRERLLDHAVHLLAVDPAIGMAEIAAAAGVGRATLYRHFPSREDLLEAISDRALAAIGEAIHACRLEEGPAPAAVERLVAALLEVGDRYVFLLGEPSAKRSEAEKLERERPLAVPLYALVERGQAAGELSPRLSATWMLTMMGAVVEAAMKEIAAGRLDRSEAPAAVSAVLLDGWRGA